MKKLFTLAITMIALFTSMNVLAADDGYRRTWDFRDGYSQRTIDKLTADPAHWQVQSTGFQNCVAMTKGPAQVWVDGVAEDIPELKGLKLNCLGTANHTQIVTTYSGVKNVPCLWINGKNSGTDEIIITVPAGENVKFAYSTHKNGDARGFKTSSTGFKDKDGKTQWTSSDNTVMNEVELINSNTEVAELKLATTNGSHIYYIIIGEGDSKDAKVTNIGYLYYEAAGKGFEDLSVVAAFKDNAEVKFTGIKVDDAVPTVESLAEYDVVMLDNSLPVSNTALVDFLKANIQWQPTINLNPSLAEALGYGEQVATESNFVQANDITKGWFKTLKTQCDEGLINDGSNLMELEDGAGVWYYGINNEESATGLNIANGTHASEKSLAEAINGEGETVGTVNYVHNSGYNEYVYYGMGNSTTESSTIVLNEIIYDAASSKSEVQTCKAPVCTPTYKDLRTLVALSCTTSKSKIYYTIDGTDPTVESALYDGTPIEFTTEGMVKAVAISDGYKLSPVSTYEVILKNQAKEPIITVEGGGKNADAVITITSDQDVDIYYNFSGSSATSASSVYTGPITMTHACTITAFAIGKEGVALVQSENATQQIAANMGNIRIDQLAHFTADGWNTLADLTLDGETMTAWTNSNYYFTWGKTAVASVIVSDDEFEMDGEGNPVMDEFGTPVPLKTPRTPSVTECAKDPDWKIQSAGQVMIWQNNGPTKNVGDGSGYNPEVAEDMEGDLATKNDIQFAGKASGDTNNAYIISKNKYVGPLKLVTIIATTAANNSARTQFEVSTDGETWTAVGEQFVPSEIQRLYKKHEANYDGEEEVYVRLKSVSGGSLSIHDIYVFNHGEKSAAAEEEFTGIQDATIAPAAKILKAVKFIKNNQLYIKTADGIYTVSGAKVK